MIEANQVYKIGRKDKILSVIDNLQVNDFSNVQDLVSNINGIFSRLQVTLVDKSKKTNNKSTVFSHNLTINEFQTVENMFKNTSNNLIQRIESITNFCIKKANNINLYQKSIQAIQAELIENKLEKIYERNCSIYNKSKKETQSFLTSLKVNPYRKDNQGRNPVSKISLTYEGNLTKDARWKLSFETGSCVANTGKTAFLQGAMKPNTYKKENVSFILMTEKELLDGLKIISHYITLWENAYFPVMLNHRKNFLKRFKENNYDESSIEKWNNN